MRKQMFLTCVQKYAIHEMCGGRVRCCDLYSSLSNIFRIATKPNITLVRSSETGAGKSKYFHSTPMMEQHSAHRLKFYPPLSVHVNMLIPPPPLNLYNIIVCPMLAFRNLDVP